jgi:[acyl-carrier-protein] S-malonyltransferase
VGKIAFLFPGQGSQKVGMGADLLESRPDVFDRYLEQADAASGLPIRRLCLEGPIEELTATEAAQPALFATSLAVAGSPESRASSPTSSRATAWASTRRRSPRAVSGWRTACDSSPSAEG